MKSIGVFLLVLVLLEGICSEGCWKEERDALLVLKSHFGDMITLTSWEDDTDCCLWERVKCNTTTRRVAQLDLYQGEDQSLKPLHLNFSDFIVFKDLKTLNLQFTNMLSCVETHQGLENLEVLDLGFSDFHNATSMLSCFDGLSSLKSLLLVNFFNETPFDVLHTFFETLPSKLVHLEVLDISDNELTNEILPSLRRFTSLKELYLSRNYDLGDEFFRGIGELISLKVLTISGCMIKGSLIGKDWSKLKKLEELDLSNNEFTGPLPSSFINMTSLRTLKLARNHFTGNIGLNLASLTSLEYLSFEGNQFEFPISFTPFFNNSNLRFIYGNDNKVITESPSNLESWVPKFQIQELQLSSTTDFKSIPLPNFLLYQHNLTNLDLTGCKLGGEFPNWLLKNNTNMKELFLKNCSFNGEFKLPYQPLVNLKKIDISHNSIKGQLLMKNISSIFPSLQLLYMYGNEICGSIPYELSQLNWLQDLDLSDNQLSGEIPYNISGSGQPLIFLKLSNNKLVGSVPSIWSNDGLQELYLDGNFLSGSIPSGFYNSSTIYSLNLRNNYFIGEISSHLKYLSRLKKLDLSNNHFRGSIPSELEECGTLEFLDLSQNHLTGCVPSFAKSPVGFIHLSDNNLSGLSKNMFNTTYTSPILLDLSYNEIINGIQDLMQDLSYTKLRILLMSGNQLTGNIPKQLCQLESLNILDLSSNNFSGEIPDCLDKIQFQIESDLDFYDIKASMMYGTETYTEKAKFTSKRRTETYTGSILIYMSGIDLSCNKLNGSIPSTLGNLTRVRALNLSHNYLTGKIPSTFSNLLQVESFDLSFNMLNGEIPPQLCGLTSLEVFSVAHNNLSGPTPERKEQFSTFDESSYEGNQFLCGPPLPKSCNANGQAPTTLPNVSNEDGDHDDWMDMYVFRVSFVVAYPSVLLVIATVLYINPYWRQAWFYYVELVRMNSYYFIEDHLCKFF